MYNKIKATKQILENIMKSAKLMGNNSKEKRKPYQKRRGDSRQ